MSFLFSYFSSTDSSVTENAVPIAPIVTSDKVVETQNINITTLDTLVADTSVINSTEPVLNIEEIKDPVKSEQELIDECNKQWFSPSGYKLTKEGDICFRLRNTCLGETYILYVVPYCYPNSDVSYRLGIKEIFYPHIKKFDAFRKRMENRNIYVSPINLQTMQIGIDPTVIRATTTWTNVAEGLSISSQTVHPTRLLLTPNSTKSAFYLHSVNGKIYLSDNRF